MFVYVVKGKNYVQDAINAANFAQHEGVQTEYHTYKADRMVLVNFTENDIRQMGELVPPSPNSLMVSSKHADVCIDDTRDAKSIHGLSIHAGIHGCQFSRYEGISYDSRNVRAPAIIHDKNGATVDMEPGWYLFEYNMFRNWKKIQHVVGGLYIKDCGLGCAFVGKTVSRYSTSRIMTTTNRINYSRADMSFDALRIHTGSSCNICDVCAGLLWGKFSVFVWGDVDAAERIVCAACTMGGAWTPDTNHYIAFTVESPIDTVSAIELLGGDLKDVWHSVNRGFTREIVGHANTLCITTDKYIIVYVLSEDQCFDFLLSGYYEKDSKWHCKEGTNTTPDAVSGRKIIFCYETAKSYKQIISALNDPSVTA